MFGLKKWRQEKRLRELFTQCADLHDKASTFGRTPHDNRLIEMREQEMRQILWDQRPKQERRALQAEGKGPQDEVIDPQRFQAQGKSPKPGK